MRALVQRVRNAAVTVDGVVAGRIGTGLVVFLGVNHEDTNAHADQLAQRVARLRIFPDAESKMNLSILDVQGELLVVSQFTLYADTQKGNRPSYAQAAPADMARPLYDYFVNRCRDLGIRVETGIFQAYMQVELVNDGPVTILCESKSK